MNGPRDTLKTRKERFAHLRPLTARVHEQVDCNGLSFRVFGVFADAHFWISAKGFLIGQDARRMTLTEE
jgi:hypothetical protein